MSCFLKRQKEELALAEEEKDGCFLKILRKRMRAYDNASGEIAEAERRWTEKETVVFGV